MRVGITERGDAALHLPEWIAAAKKKKVDFTVAITKAPHTLLENLDILPPNLIIHATITGWGGTQMEPGVLTWDKEVTAYLKLVELFGPDKVVLRVDPIIPIREGIAIAHTVAGYCKGRLRISVLDFFIHAEDRMIEAGNPIARMLAPLYNTNTHLPKPLRAEILKSFPNAEICGEMYFPSVGCISNKDYVALGLTPPTNLDYSKQRPSCSCLAVKTELLGHNIQCKHGCLYCYWRPHPNAH
jgi:hypothetical protein